MRILVIGGAGFIGHHTANELAEQGHQVRVFDSLHPQVHTDPSESIQRLHASVEFLKGDIRSHEDLKCALNGIEVVYHFAAETGVGQSMHEISRYVDVNARGTAVLCEILARDAATVKKLILASSRAVYGEGGYRCKRCGDIFPPSGRFGKDLVSGKWEFDCPECGSPLVPSKTGEDAPLHPVSVYGITKKTQEELCAVFSRTFGVPTLILRYFNVYGPGQCLTNPYTGIAITFYSRMDQGEPVDIFEDGAMLRDFVHVRDVVQANLKVLALGEPGVTVMNIGSGQAVSILEFANLLRTLTGSRSPIEISGRYRLGDIRHSRSDISRASRMIGYEPRVSLKEGLRGLIAWASSRPSLPVAGRPLQELSAFGLTGVGKKEVE